MRQGWQAPDPGGIVFPRGYLLAPDLSLTSHPETESGHEQIFMCKCYREHCEDKWVSAIDFDLVEVNHGIAGERMKS